MVFLNTVLYTHSNKKKKKLKPKNFLSSPKHLTSPLHHLLAACSTLHGSSPNRRTLNPNQTSWSLNTFEERPCRRCEGSHGCHRSRSLSRPQNQPPLSRTLCAQGALVPKKVEGKILLCLR
ncbi:hypothetical protein HanLR1_Chr01g0007851 [Helianthus annuus]|nr:hypothetical protein HanHA89_Chr01g0008831 [Helianthus annuus]KAJ0782409.1 hypothetical protein HanLR1_Chr01g0007851 [Helianthus annuus]